MLKENKLLAINFNKVNKIVHKIFYLLGTIIYKVLSRYLFIYGIYEFINLLFSQY